MNNNALSRPLHHRLVGGEEAELALKSVGVLGAERNSPCRCTGPATTPSQGRQYERRPSVEATTQSALKTDIPVAVAWSSASGATSSRSSPPQS